MRITKRQLRRIIREEKARLLKEQRATAMGMTGRSDELFDARGNLLGLIETLNPDEAVFFIEDLIKELETVIDQALSGLPDSQGRRMPQEGIK